MRKVPFRLLFKGWGVIPSEGEKREKPRWGPGLTADDAIVADHQA
jgi:hypothetical protein